MTTRTPPTPTPRNSPPDAAATPLAALALGSNRGPSEALLRQAVRRLAPWFEDLRVASLYVTRPVSPISQPDFSNTAVCGRTGLAADDLLALGKRLELAAGRRPGPRHGPRELDVDLLVYGDRVSALPELTLPHPRLRERRFFLAPLAEIAPRLAVPPDGTTVAELLARLPGPREAPRSWDPLQGI